MDNVMAKREKHQAVPAEMLSKEFLSRFKTEQDVSHFLKDLLHRYLNRCYKARWIPIWVTKSIPKWATTPVTPAMGLSPRRYKPNTARALFRYLVIATVTSILLWFPNTRVGGYLSKSLLYLCTPKV